MRFTTPIILAAALALTLSSSKATAQDWTTTGNAASSGNFVGTTNAQDLKIRTNNADRMRILQSNGNIGIGTITPQRLLHLYDGRTTFAGPQMNLGDVNGSYEFWGGSSFIILNGGVEWLKFDGTFGTAAIGPQSEITLDVINNQMTIGMGTNPPLSALTVGGSITPTSNCSYDIGSFSYRWNTIYACNGTIQTSDLNLKENIKAIPYGLDAIAKLNPVSYTWKDDPGYGTKLGLLAQNVQGVISEVVKTSDDGSRMGIFYSDLIPVLIKGVQEQKAVLDSEETETQDLLRQLQEQSVRIQQLEQALAK